MIQSTQCGNNTLLTWQHSPTDLTPAWFEPSFWQQQDKIYAQKTGRATTWFFKHDELKAVLRHYWRGGLVGKILQDQYLNLGIKRSRVYREFMLLCQLHQQGFNVPTPVAACFSQAGLIYRADIITQAITGADSLLDRLQIKALTQDEIIKIAKCIADFHNAGVFHADLNINNILFDDKGEIFLIDFDRGQLKPPAQSWQQANINRLLRSFNKQAKRLSCFYWTKQDWALFISHYQKNIKKA